MASNSFPIQAISAKLPFEISGPMDGGGTVGFVLTAADDFYGIPALTLIVPVAVTGGFDEIVAGGLGVGNANGGLKDVFLYSTLTGTVTAPPVFIAGLDFSIGGAVFGDIRYNSYVVGASVNSLSDVFNFSSADGSKQFLGVAYLGGGFFEVVLGGALSNIVAAGVFQDVNRTQILTVQQAAVADATALTVVDQLNALLAAVRTHGLIAT